MEGKIRKYIEDISKVRSRKREGRNTSEKQKGDKGKGK